MFNIEDKLKGLVLNPKQEIIFCVGLPGSGKSTWAKEYVSSHINFVRINKDDVREMMGNLPYKKSTESYVLFIERLIGIVALENGKSIIVDDTNFSKIHNDFWSNVSKITGAKFIEKHFLVDVDECIRRDSGRQKSVGKDVILKMYREQVKNTKYDIYG